MVFPRILGGGKLMNFDEGVVKQKNKNHKVSTKTLNSNPRYPAKLYPKYMEFRHDIKIFTPPSSHGIDFPGWNLRPEVDRLLRFPVISLPFVCCRECQSGILSSINRVGLSVAKTMKTPKLRSTECSFFFLIHWFLAIWRDDTLRDQLTWLAMENGPGLSRCVSYWRWWFSIAIC